MSLNESELGVRYMKLCEDTFGPLGHLGGI